MTVLDISNTADPKEIGFFDTFPVSDNTSFNGAWGVYPYLPSGIILISDISSGLYVVKDNTLDTAQGTVSFDASSYEIEEGDTALISVARENGSEGEVSVKWEILAGATDSGDLTAESGILNWASGEDQAQVISIPVSSDNKTEPKESFFIRLYDPSGSVSLKSPSISIISIKSDGGSIENKSPVVDAGVDISVDAGDSVSLQGSATDEDSTDLTYLWEQLSGTAVSITQSDNASAQFIAPTVASELSLQLVVTDDQGAMASDTVIVSVTVPPPPPPVVVETKSSGGGCTISNSGQSDSSLFMLMFFAILLAGRRRYLAV